MLKTCSIVWRSQLPRSLCALCLRLHDCPLAPIAEELPHLTAALRRLPALRHFKLCVTELPPHLAPLLAALWCCPLTYLELSSCHLAGLPGPLPPSVEVVVLDDNSALHLREWLPALAALPRCHSVSFHNGDNRFARLDWMPRQSFDASAVAGSLAAAPALRHLRCKFEEGSTMQQLAAARAAAALPPVRITGAVTMAWDRCQAAKPWCDYEALVAAPAIRYRPCAVLPNPQLDPNPLWAFIH